MQPLAVITMAYNERNRMLGWVDHYRRQVGLQNCYIVDHGSDDESTKRIGTSNRIRLPRSAQDNDKRTAFISDLARGLLRYYSKVAYVDADELLVADPGRFKNLNDYAARMTADAVTSIGLEIVHGEGEAPLDPTGSIGAQRGSVIFSSSMCKTNMIGRPVTWAAGWHSHDGPPRFDGLYLFHLRHADRDQAIERLELTRAMAWASEQAGLHQRTDNVSMERLVAMFGKRPLLDDASITDPDGPLAEDLKAFLADVEVPASPGMPYRVPLARYGRQRLPLGPDFTRILSGVRAGPPAPPPLPA